MRSRFGIIEVTSQGLVRCPFSRFASFERNEAMTEIENQTHDFKKFLKRAARRVLAPVLPCRNYQKVPQVGVEIICAARVPVAAEVGADE